MTKSTQAIHMSLYSCSTSPVVASFLAHSRSASSTTSTIAAPTRVHHPERPVPVLHLDRPHHLPHQPYSCSTSRVAASFLARSHSASFTTSTSARLPGCTTQSAPFQSSTPTAPSAFPTNLLVPRDTCDRISGWRLNISPTSLNFPTIALSDPSSYVADTTSNNGLSIPSKGLAPTRLARVRLHWCSNTTSMCAATTSTTGFFLFLSPPPLNCSKRKGSIGALMVEIGRVRNR